MQDLEHIFVEFLLIKYHCNVFHRIQLWYLFRASKVFHYSYKYT